MTKSVVAVAAALLLVLCATALGQNILGSSSTPAGYFIFGGSGFWPNSEYRYGEAPVTTSYTASLHHPTYLNVLHYYSQSSGGCNIKVYISTGIQCVIDRQTDPHCHQNWWNAASANPDYYVGEFYCSPSYTVTTFNIESWIASHPATDYCILFDQQDGGADVCIFETWLGPQGTIGILEPQQCPSEAGSSQPACSPNPSTGRTTIHYCISRPGTVSVRILDVTGRAVRSLCSGYRAVGTQTAMWDGLGDAGSRVPVGSYFFEVTSDGSSSMGKIVLQ